MTPAIPLGYGENQAQALLLGVDPAWGHSSGLEMMLSRLGFRVCVGSAGAAAPQSIALAFVQCPSAERLAVERLNDLSLSREGLCFGVVPTGVDPLPFSTYLHGTLTLPLEESTLIDALAAQHYVALTVSERRALNAKLDELACGDQAVVQHFIRLMIDTNATTLAALRDAFSARSWDAIASAAHRLAGSARMLDCVGMIAFLVRLECAATDRELELTRAILRVVADTVDSLGVVLRELLDSPTPPRFIVTA